MMVIHAKHSKLKLWKSELTCVFLTKNDETNPWLNELDEIYGSLFKDLMKSREFGADEESIHVLHGNNKTKSKRIGLVGLGETKDLEWDTFRKAAAKAVKTAHAIGIEKISLIFPSHLVSEQFDESGLAQAVVEGALLADYRYDKYQTDQKAKISRLEELTLITYVSPSDRVYQGVRAAEVICDAVSFTRDLANAPGNELTPRELATRTAQMCRKNKIKIQIFDEKKLALLKMGGILGVAQGSSEPPRMIIMEYTGVKAKNRKPIVLVGKGLTFDAGGISIKPAADMDRMKFDMCGGAAVIGAMQAIAHLKLPLHVVGIVPSSENLLGSKAFKPGDVLTMYSGKTVEVLNTDAEGRLILADALAYAQKYKPEAIIDLATLTGHCVIALGYAGAGMMGNDPNVKSRLMDASKISSEKVWELPMWKEFDKQIKSHIADIKNMGGRPAGAITAAAFLKHFVGDYPWVHLDIAGTANSEEELPYTARISSTGFGVRLLVEALRKW
ncbi:leucyl aminopeptidase [bacterium]|nr:leucyl aminopeptidase [bacterium]